MADDLTGALDSAARFVPLTGPIATTWRAAPMPQQSVAIDTATRDLSAADACAAIARFAPLLATGEPAFKKIDSLLRGHVALELAACLAHFDHCILAPAFPFQGRVTRGGRQLVRDGEHWRDTGVDLPAALRQYGIDSPLRDAETDADLDAIVSEGRGLTGRVLWCGTGGLAGALAGHGPVPKPDLPSPVLALIGSDHPVSAAQFAAVPHLHARLPQHDTTTIARLLERGAAVATVTLPTATPRDAACRRITAHFAAMLRAIDRPGTLFVSGGETLRHLCDALNATHLDVDGEIEPGVPTSVLRGGDWDGQRLVSKSGAFGDGGFLQRLLRPANVL
jgi:D-threonate/D-erythronate kinase